MNKKASSFVKTAALTAIIASIVHAVLFVAAAALQFVVMPMFMGKQMLDFYKFTLPLASTAQMLIFVTMNIILGVVAYGKNDKKGSIAGFIIPIIVFLALSLAMPAAQAFETRLVAYRGAQSIASFAAVSQYVSSVGFLSVASTMLTASVGAVRYLNDNDNN